MLKTGAPVRRGIFPSPWIVMGAALILLAVVVTLAARGIDRERQTMSRILSEKGGALIKAFEAGARTGMMGMMWGGSQVQRLLEETARQPDIVYLMVIDREGRILAHSDPRRIGQTVDSIPPAGAIERWRLTQLSDRRPAFEVFRDFRPLRGGGRGMGRHNPALDCPSDQTEPGGDWCFPGNPANGAQIILVGLDMAAFDEARQEDLRNTVLISTVLVLLGLAGFISLFWVQHYRRARRSLQDVSAFAKEVVASLPVGLIATDREGRIAFFNSTAEKISGMTFDTHRGQALEALLADRWRPLQQRLAQGGRIIEEAFDWISRDGRRIPLSLSATRILNEEGHFVGHVLILRDLAEIRALQQEIRQKEKLAAIGGLAAGVAHEIRNPLSSIKGLAGYFSEKLGSNPADQEAARVMIDEVDRLNRAITALLDFARPSELKVAPTDVCDLLRRSLKLIAQDAEARGIHLSADCALKATQPVELDADRFIQCLLNLYLNAIQAMNPGGRLDVRARTNQDRELIVEVADTGPGIPEAMQPQIFDPYFTTKPRGVGLGLAVVHKIVEAHHGHISLHRAPGAGACFQIRMPVVQPHETATARTTPAGG